MQYNTTLTKGVTTVIRINQHVPDMALQAYWQDQIRELRLTDYRGQWLVVMFYPADFTFVCPTELEEAASYYDQFVAAGAEVLSVSTDTVYTHKAWHDQSPAIRKIRFPMVADPAGRLSREFGTYLEDLGLSLRGTFLIDPDGAVKAFELHDNSIGRSTEEMLRKLQAARFVREHQGEVCPAGWRPGAKTLKPGLELVGKL